MDDDAEVRNLGNDIKYGDVIVIHDPINHGYFTARLQKKCHLMVEELEFPTRQHMFTSPPESMDCLFKVTPKLFYAAQSEYNSLMKRDDVEEEVLAEAKKERAKELQINAGLCRKFRGVAVYFGSCVQFLHLKTNCYITMVKEQADADSERLKLILDEAGNENSWFFFNIAYKTMKMGANIPYKVLTLTLKNHHET